MAFHPDTSIVSQQSYPYTSRVSDPSLVQSLTRGPNASIQHQTILDYAPSVYLCQYDDALNSMWPTEPWNQGSYLNYCSLRSGDGGDSDPVIKAQPTPADLAGYPAGSGVYLSVDDGSAGSAAFQGCGYTSGASSVKYASAHMMAIVKAYAPDDGFFDIVYTGFWSVNYYQWMYLRIHYSTAPFPSVTSNIDAELADVAYHMGDWEHVTVRVALENNQPGKVLGVFFGAHGKGRWGLASDLDFDSGNHVWVSNKGNSHAFHPEQGDIQLSEPYGLAYPPVPSWLPPIVDIVSALVLMPPRIQPSHCYGYGLDKGNQEDQLTSLWVPHDPSRGGPGVVDLTPFTIDGTLPDGSNGVPDGADMSWLKYGCPFGQPQRQNKIQKIGWSQGANWESPAIIAAINLFLDVHSFDTDMSSGPASPLFQSWSKTEEFLGWQS